MALKANIVTPAGFVGNDAYCRVEEPVLTSKSSMSFVVRCYSHPAHSMWFGETKMSGPYDISGDNPFAQAYAIAKTVSPFSAGEDC
jgi:hypothetical protein